MNCDFCWSWIGPWTLERSDGIKTNLYCFYLSLKVGLLGLDEYTERLNNLFLADDGKNEILLELEFCTGSLADTIATLKAYLFDKLEQLDYNEVGKLLIDRLKKLYYNESVDLEELTHKLYKVWMLLPSEISQNLPLLSSIPLMILGLGREVIK